MLAFSGDDLKYNLGGKVTSLILKDLNGEEFNLDKTLAEEDIKGVVFVFLSYRCPASVRSDELYIKLAGEFKEKGILFYGIDANMRTENLEAMKTYAEKTKYNFPVLWDEGNVIADRFDAQKTPHAFFVDKESVLRYKGRIRTSKETTLANIIDEYLAGKKLSATETRPDG